jgi:hypothetical protein
VLLASASACLHGGVFVPAIGRSDEPFDSQKVCETRGINPRATSDYRYICDSGARGPLDELSLLLVERGRV